MRISKEDLEHAAALAMLELTAAEKSLYTAQLGAILEYIQELDKLVLDDIEPTIHIQQQRKNVLREDQAGGSEKDLLRRVFEAAPEQEKGYFLVPLVID